MSRKFASHVERVRAISGSLSGRLFAYGGVRDDATLGSSVHVLSASKLTEQASLAVGSAVTALCFLADDLLVAGGTNGVLYGIEVGDTAVTLRFSVPALSSAVTALARDDGGLRLVATAEDGHVAVFALVVESATPRLQSLGTRRVSARPLRAAVV
jgi:hypothetical protein